MIVPRMFFLFSTGSAAALINSNSDIARRAIYEKIYPLSFTEFIKIKYNKFEVKNLAKDLRDIIFLVKMRRKRISNYYYMKKINEYYLGISRLDFENYLYYGSLPFMIALDNEALVYDQISKSLDRVINKDIPQMRSLTSEIVSRISAVLYAVADMDAINFTTLAEKFGISRPKIAEIFSVLEQAEILHRIYPHGSHFKQVTQNRQNIYFLHRLFAPCTIKQLAIQLAKKMCEASYWKIWWACIFIGFATKNLYIRLLMMAPRAELILFFTIDKTKIVIEVGVNKKNMGK